MIAGIAGFSDCAPIVENMSASLYIQAPSLPHCSHLIIPLFLFAFTVP
jgi:hypothetical protein